MTKQEAIKMILTELAKAEEKFPDWPGDKIHGAGVITEETGELMQACIDYEYAHFDNDLDQSIRMIDEAVQVGAMAIRFLIHM